MDIVGSRTLQVCQSIVYQDCFCISHMVILFLQYVNPNYKGYGRNEYFGYSKSQNQQGYYGSGCQKNDDGSYHCYNTNINNSNKKYTNNYYSNYYDDDTFQSTKDDYTDPMSKLDCHSLDTEWQLMGVYRESFYDFFEQVSKHLWYYDDYEYKVAISGLEYMDDGECNYVGTDAYGNSLYAAPQPMLEKIFEMSLYTDFQCLSILELVEKFVVVVVSG